MRRGARVNVLLLLAVVLLAVLPVALGMGDHKAEPFAGADAEAETAITKIDPDYRPWFSPVYEPPSGEIESGLFALQAAVGAGVVAYCLGLWRGRRQGEARASAAGGGAADGTAGGLPGGTHDGAANDEAGSAGNGEARRAAGGSAGSLAGGEAHPAGGGSSSAGGADSGRV
ncbi:energy-coupling factor ABC transporter substrate-binding protein [Streptomyces abyssomicinicus]|uniref:energy-coupling factor ABC transporter substrate-binding protein n=1 Tax=Streptomyces abyssomicinicus TaxID=574929 RepID=UPI00124FC485|nr:energy-coupling factor ABC transporter substrate-binding protein [Streptomyces abyssomicinicus]